MRLAPALALACLMVPGIAEAAVVSYSAPASGAEEPTGNTIADFDPSLGTLERVQLRLTGTVSDELSFYVRRPSYHGGSKGEYSGHYPNYAVIEASATPFVRVAWFGIELRGDPVASFIMTVDGSSYWGGYSTSVDVTADLPFQAFGNSPGGEAMYTLAADSGWDWNDPVVPYVSWSRPEFQGVATVTYTYRPVGVPEPASIALLGLGGAGCVAARRRVAGVAVSRRRPA